MNITPFTIYLWQLADNISCLFSVTGFLLLFVSAAIAIIGGCLRAEYLEEGQIAGRRLHKFLFLTIPLGFISMIISVAIPSSKTIAMMYVIPKIAESKAIQQDLPDLYEEAISALKDQF